MYEKFFGLRERPFDITPNPRFMYFTPRHREALVSLQFGIESRKGVVVLIGDAGLGKTTVIRAAIEKQPAEVRCVYLNNPLLTRAEFIEFLANSLGLSPAAERSKTRLVAELSSRLSEERQRGASVVLLVDEAQSLSNELLEELRMLTNIETDTEKLVTLVLVGQPQLADRLNDEGLGQLKQRVELRCTLSPFDIAETVMYIKNRVRIAGGDAVQMFTRGAIQVIHERSRGIPRSISVICENALVGAFAENQKPVTRALVEEICNELDLSPEPLIADEPEAPVVMKPAVPARNEITTATAPVATPAQPSSNGHGEGSGYRDGSSVVATATATARRWLSFPTAGRRS